MMTYLNFKICRKLIEDKALPVQIKVPQLLASCSLFVNPNRIISDCQEDFTLAGQIIKVEFTLNSLSVFIEVKDFLSILFSFSKYLAIHNCCNVLPKHITSP